MQKMKIIFGIVSELGFVISGNRDESYAVNDEGMQSINELVHAVKK
ncbi:hypothetical protein FLJC2902T_31240 [Flavobacterium limnosediminis JC2902]|uniref:Uncharacterized protein n=1 Tax=Flavobacterium limnosediminis JC2902 TaxID=1341181 RepID=V6SFG3_9FLAO|nr:hypothetical protein [Flavobacterium limnosediminis]ESU25316.1 hypothetical protein FLJC2902T_31240 [Flavobacterium limnosediminis JC2902]